MRTPGYDVECAGPGETTYFPHQYLFIVIYSVYSNLISPIAIFNAKLTNQTRMIESMNQSNTC